MLTKQTTMQGLAPIMRAMPCRIRHLLAWLRCFPLSSHPCSPPADFYEEHFGVGGHQDSALRILDVALGAAEGDCKVRLATWAR